MSELKRGDLGEVDGTPVVYDPSDPGFPWEALPGQEWNRWPADSSVRPMALAPVGWLDAMRRVRDLHAGNGNGNCQECGDDEGGFGAVAWPCPTRLLVDVGRVDGPCQHCDHFRESHNFDEQALRGLALGHCVYSGCDCPSYYPAPPVPVGSPGKEGK